MLSFFAVPSYNAFGPGNPQRRRLRLAGMYECAGSLVAFFWVAGNNVFISRDQRILCDFALLSEPSIWRHDGYGLAALPVSSGGVRGPL
jgi:hypothetical protein